MEAVRRVNGKERSEGPKEGGTSLCVVIASISANSHIFQLHRMKIKYGW